MLALEQSQCQVTLERVPIHVSNPTNKREMPHSNQISSHQSPFSTSTLPSQTPRFLCNNFIHCRITMNTPRIQIFPHLRQQNLQLFITPLQHIHIQPQAKALDPLGNRRVIIRPRNFHPLLLGHSPIGSLYIFITMIVKPASRIHCSSLGPRQGSRPSIRPA